MRLAFRLPLALPLVLVGCATSPTPALPALARLSVPALDYRAELSDRGLVAVEYEAGEVEAVDGGGMVGITCVVLALDEPSAAELMSASGLRAFTTGAADARELVRACREREGTSLIDSPRLILNDGQSGHITIANQTAYVSGFRLVQDERALLADPVVDVFSSGLVFEVAAEAASDADPDADPGTATVRLDVRLELADLFQPVADHEVALGGGLSSMTIQEPLMTRQSLATELELRPDECLVLIAEDLERKGHARVALLMARRLTPEEVDGVKGRGNGPRIEDLFRLPG